MKPRRKAKPKVWSGEEALSEIKSVSIRLESGKIAKFVLAREMAVSDDPDVMREQALAAHARFAFWSYQADRALSAVRDAETALAKLEGDRRYRYSKVTKDEDRFTGSAVVEGLVDSDAAVLAARNELNQLREHWTILKTAAAALDHRTHLLRRLLANDQSAIRG